MRFFPTPLFPTASEEIKQGGEKVTYSPGRHCLGPAEFVYVSSGRFGWALYSGALYSLSQKLVKTHKNTKKGTVATADAIKSDIIIAVYILPECFFACVSVCFYRRLLLVNMQIPHRGVNVSRGQGELGDNCHYNPPV